MAILPTNLYTAAQTRELDANAKSGSKDAGYALMQKAGEAVLRLVLEKYPGVQKMLVVCGGGNNGGDGYVVARLANEKNISADVLPLVEPAALGNEAAKAVQDWQGTGSIVSINALNDNYDVIIDAMLGTGLTRDVEEDYLNVIKHINQHQAKVVSVDVPSGVHSDSGRVMGAAVKANMTMSFIGLNQGLFTGQAPDYTGEVFFNNLGVAESAYSSVTATGERVEQDFVNQLLQPRARTAHKGDCGHVLIVGGNRGMSGAVLLAGQAALRTGAGLVTIATRQGHSAFINVNQPELMCHGISELKQLMPLIKRASVIAIGPGLGQDVWAEEVFKAVVASKKPVLLDADALNLLAQDYTERSNWVLTPHPGEAARLTGTDTLSVQQDRYSVANSLADHYQATVLLKGAGSIVSEAGRAEYRLIDKGNPGMASGGMGDCLTGIIAALMAQGLSNFDAVSAGAYLHGLAADRVARVHGERGMVASDLFPQIHKLVNP